MIKSIKAENYKSIKSLELELGRVNVFIGENGAGKSNILEVFALAGAAVARKLDNEFLSSRGIRVTEPEHMRSAFKTDASSQPVRISLTNTEDSNFSIELHNEDFPYQKWNYYVTENIYQNNQDGFINFSEVMPEQDLVPIISIFSNLNKESNKVTLTINRLDNGNFLVTPEKESKNTISSIQSSKNRQKTKAYLINFIIFSPENSALKIFQREGQIEPLGINGEGLLKLLSVLSREEYGETLQEIKESLQVLGWFEDFNLVAGDHFSPQRIAIKDRYVEETGRYFDQMSANEGFLFLLFYFALFSTSLTPSIFAIDNIDASLNPKLCEKLLAELVRLAKKHDKQVLLTTHNPATLDGLNLHDDEQRLFVVSRGHEGETRVKRLQIKPRNSDKDRPIRLSEMFLRGSLGGLPTGF